MQGDAAAAAAAAADADADSDAISSPRVKTRACIRSHQRPKDALRTLVILKKMLVGCEIYVYVHDGEITKYRKVFGGKMSHLKVRG